MLKGLKVKAKDGTEIVSVIKQGTGSTSESKKTYVTFTMGTQNITVTVPKQDP